MVAGVDGLKPQCDLRLKFKVALQQPDIASPPMPRDRRAKP
jgi:hypothetical protein